MPGWPDTFLLATSSAGKAEELRALLRDGGIASTVKTYADFSLKAPDETEDSFIGNARIKTRAGVAATSLATLADDSGLCIEALNGAPGVYSADWAELGDGSRDFTRAMARIDKELGDKPRDAYFTCTLVLQYPDGEEIVAEGMVRGTLLKAGDARGTNGHGYDAWFMPQGFDKSFGELSGDEKNRLSHRKNAFAVLMARLRT